MSMFVGVWGNIGSGGVGPPGPPGPAGPAGPTGASGSTWYNGSGAPAAGLGVNGDYYLNIQSDDVYTKSGGAWTITANIRGSVWYNGAGIPGAGLGRAGDYYLNVTNGDVYTKTVSWAVIANIKGPTGATGATGPTGATGASGVQLIGYNHQTGSSYTLQLSDAGKLIGCDSGSFALNVPTNASVAFTVGVTVIDICQIGMGKVTVIAPVGVTVNSLGGLRSTAGQYVTLSLFLYDVDTWLLLGNLIA